MKIKITYLYIGLTYAISNLFITSCQKELGALPENAKVDGNTVLNVPTALTALNGVYFRFARVSPFSNITEWSYNERLPALLSGHLMYGYGIGANSPENNQMVNSSGTYWLYSYEIINASNSLIDAMDKLPPGRIPTADRESIEGQARFLRAYGHFKLLTFYAQWFDHDSPYGVLLRDKAITTENISKSRSSVADSYTAILTDLDYAIAHCPVKNPKHYATSAAAKALKARVLLCRGLPGDYEEIIKLADQIISQGAYHLESRAKDLFRTKGESSPEVILSITPQPNQPVYAYNRSYQFYPGASALYCATQDFHAILQDDPRLEWLVGSFRERDANYFFTKYIAEGSTPSNITETYYAIRLTEIYLMKAEAILRNHGDTEDAKAILKLIGTHNGLTDFSKLNALNNREDILLYNYYETSKCLVSEDGQEWLALLRLPLSTITSIRPKLINTIQYILPVPNSEFANNPTFGEQNPGYNIDL